MNDMRQVELGRGGPKVGAVGLGCMSFGGMYGATDVETSHATLKRALDLGVTHLDIADIYGGGVCEEIVGAFLKQNGNPFTIATKAGIVTRPQRGSNNGRDYLSACLDGSLKRLGVERVDLFYIHRRDPSVPVEEVMETLVGFIRAGKIGAIGFSEIAPWTLERAARIHPVAAVQSEYSLWTRQPELGMIDLCRRLGTSFVSFSPVARGMLTDAEPDPSTFPAGDFRSANPRFEEPHFSQNVEKIRAFRAYAAARGVAASTLAIAWTFARAPGSIAIPGTRSPAHLDENAAAAGLHLSTADLAEIEAILPAGFAHGPRYSAAQATAVEDYC
jgi:aryl-alcohol dehydrogenase-like predicted oxidoreductase